MGEPTDFKLPPPARGSKATKLASMPEVESHKKREDMLTRYNVSWVGSTASATPPDRLLTKTSGAGGSKKLLGLADTSGKAHSDFYSGALGDPSAVSSRADLRPVADNIQSDSGLQHLSYECPGLHDRNARQDIGRRTFRQFLATKLVIPLFQRRYCWRGDVVAKWFEDVRGGTRDHLGIHNTGNVVVRYSEQDGGYMLIDGQQRVTTSLLLIAAIRDTVEQIPGGEQEKEKLLSELNNWLFVKEKTTGALESRLLPCLMDRDAYYSILHPFAHPPANQNQTPSMPAASNEETTPFQKTNYEIFRNRLERELRAHQEALQKLQALRLILNQSLDKMGVTRVDILTPVNLAQVFLWLQEKSLMGMGALLKNDRPGVRFTATDLVRNLLMAPFMDRALKEQEEIYKTYWQQPLEMRFGSAAAFSAAVESYISRHHVLATQPSQFEEAVASFNKTMPNLRDVEMYAKFVTIYENRRQEMADRPLVEVSLYLLDSIRTFFN